MYSVSCFSCKKTCDEFDVNLKEKYFPNYENGNQISFKNNNEDTITFVISSIAYNNSPYIERNCKCVCTAEFEMSIINDERNISFEMHIAIGVLGENSYAFVTSLHTKDSGYYFEKKILNVSKKEYKKNIAIFGDTIGIYDRANLAYIKIVKDIGLTEFSLNDTIWRQVTY